ncbi:hypothetical protein NDI56_08405 [Haloarcula sp. S1CR25-12]|uniref:HIT-type domain-containing protein n=1 Tax=Haloarcula saliterrae TaxID=2950534 RepID=A0ABU2FC34_9EURY|nr:hypothetical protein [Haloarcula sp. S1CR25-12]MDS0259411.1 hypothetical protein [Haloarcula sp. S1CR25-12]
MSVSGLCEICQRPDVEHGCDRCGQLVCDRHWDRQLGVCIECSGQVGGRGGQDSTENLPDGVDTYRY